MSVINPVSNVGETTAAQAQATATPLAGTGAEFNDFLKLLTAQVRNQDPLSPLDSTQFVEQLASFSALEQQVHSNTSLESIAGMIGDLHAMFANDWIGQSVTVESSWVPYSGKPVEFAVDAPDDADKALLNIKNSDGETVWTEPLDLTKPLHSWDGRMMSGETATSQSLYQFGIDLYSGAEYIGTAAPQVVTKVTDIGSDGGEMRIGTSSRLTADMSKVRKLPE